MLEYLVGWCITTINCGAYGPLVRRVVDNGGGRGIWESWRIAKNFWKCYSSYMDDIKGITAEKTWDPSIDEKSPPFTVRKNLFFVIIAIPLLMLFIFSFAAFQHGVPGFRVDKSQQGLRVASVVHDINPVQTGDVVVAINGLPYARVLGLLLLPSSTQLVPPSVTVLRGEETIHFTPVFMPLTWAAYLAVAWPHLLLTTLFLTLGSIALFRAPPGQPVFLFFFMLCAFSNTIASTLPSQFGLLQPEIISLSFVSIALSNWCAFGAFAHFICRFPVERDLFRGRAVSASLLYLVPMAIAVGGALITAGLTENFFTALQRYRNLCVPLLLIGSFGKHIVDLRYLVSPSAKNQVKLSLFAYWPTFAPYLLLYLLPNLLIDQPLISFRIVLLAAVVLPAAHLIALLRYKLLGVDRLISRATAYFIVIVLLTVTYTALLALMKRWFFGRQIFSEDIFLLFLLFIALGITPLINWIQKIIDHYFFRYRPNDNAVLFEFSQKLASALQFSDLVNLINDELPRRIQISKSAFLLIEEKRSRLFPEDLRIGSSPWPESKLFQEFRRGSQAILCLEKQNDPVLNRELSQLCEAGYRLVLSLRGGTTLTGALLLGSRKDGRPYRDHDIQMLVILANQVAVALDNSLHYTSLVKSKEQLETLFTKVVQAKKMASLGEMTATLAHEIKNPLGIIRSSAQYLAKAERPAETREEMLGYIIDEVDGLDSVVSNILGLAKFKKPVLKPIDLQKHISKLCSQWQFSDDHNLRVDIQCSIASRLPLLYADYQQLRQVLLNLFLNSEEAMEDGGTITLSVEEESDFVVMRLQDNGPGIAEEYTDELFKNFFTTKDDGLGMGLTISRQIIAAHHGRITIKNLPEKGVEVEVHLPFRPLVTLGQEVIEEGHADEC